MYVEAKDTLINRCRPRSIISLAVGQTVLPSTPDAGTPEPALKPSALWKIVELGGVVDEDVVAYRLVGCPIEHQID